MLGLLLTLSVPVLCRAESTEARIALDQRLMEYIAMLEDLKDPNDEKERVADVSGSA
jgi:hypothetical protein